MSSFMGTQQEISPPALMEHFLSKPSLYAFFSEGVWLGFRHLDYKLSQCVRMRIRFELLASLMIK